MRMFGRTLVVYFVSAFLGFGNSRLIAENVDINLRNSEITTTESEKSDDPNGKTATVKSSPIVPCCVRQTKHLALGEDLSGETIFVDIGHCPKYCDKTIQRAEFEELLRLNKSVDPLEAYLALQRRHHSCNAHATICAPTEIKVERYFTMSGLREVDVIESCHCTMMPKMCQRSSKVKVFYPGTPYEVKLDVGQCMGKCAESDTNPDFGCKPSRNHTTTIKGPNGDEVISVIQKCQCLGDCYRMSMIESVYDYSRLEEEEESGEGEQRSESLIKEIDVGQCVGSCSKIFKHYRCTLRDWKNPTKCLSGLYATASTCKPTSFDIHTYTNRQGVENEIYSVKHCGC